jgi:hypothetical protein
MPNLSSRIVCTSKIGKLSEQVGVHLGVGFGYGYFDVSGGGFASHLERLLVISYFLSKAIYYLSYSDFLRVYYLSASAEISLKFKSVGLSSLSETL